MTVVLNRKHDCKPGDGCPYSVTGSDGHQYRVEQAADGRWSVHDCTGVSGRGEKGMSKPLLRRADPPSVGSFDSWAEAVAAVTS